MMFAGLLAVAAALVVASASPVQIQQATSATLNPYPNQPRITFRKDGTFHLTVFSDLHYGENEDSFGIEQDIQSEALMRKVLLSERPDYVVLNGDLITSENTYKENATMYIDKIVKPLVDYRIPFSSTHGNHDNGQNISHTLEIKRENLVAGKLSYTRFAPNGIGGPRGPGNYWVPVYKNGTSKSPAIILWFFDSRSGRYSDGNATKPSSHVPDYVDPSVGPWITSQLALMDSAWGPACETRQSLAFVHIPPHAIQAVSETLNNKTNPGLDDDSLGAGSSQASSPSTAGKDTVWWNTLTTQVKNLRAIVSGHDHGNEWCAREPTKDVIFCFDKHSGYGGYSSATWGHGVRNFLFNSTNPTGGLETWIRLEEGETRARVVLNNEYGR